MPKSKIRKRYPTMHYNPNSKIIPLEHRESGRPIRGKQEKKGLNIYLGSRITAENRREYEQSVIDSNIQRMMFDIEAEIERIMFQEDKDDTEINKELELFDKSKMTDGAIKMLAKTQARFQVNKENKHYKAWLKGRSFFKYKGQMYPVMTDKFIKDSQSIKDIVKIDNNE